VPVSSPQHGPTANGRVADGEGGEDARRRGRRRRAPRQDSRFRQLRQCCPANHRVTHLVTFRSKWDVFQTFPNPETHIFHLGDLGSDTSRTQGWGNKILDWNRSIGETIKTTAIHPFERFRSRTEGDKRLQSETTQRNRAAWWEGRRPSNPRSARLRAQGKVRLREAEHTAPGARRWGVEGRAGV